MRRVASSAGRSKSRTKMVAPVGHAGNLGKYRRGSGMWYDAVRHDRREGVSANGIPWRPR
jgi:hypothetical protein